MAKKHKLKTTVLSSILELESWLKEQPQFENRISLVPTMGALHEGHFSLVRLAAQSSDTVIASIFVNPLQFGPTEDFKRYPRTLEKDLLLLEKAGCDAVFTPQVEDLYFPDRSTTVIENQLSQVLCGHYRPGHFAGVTTVVLKLLNLVRPQILILGRKDYQQCAILSRMMRDLNVGVRLTISPTIREADGLAMSSRNAFLSPAERLQAPRIFGCLETLVSEWRAGETRAAVLRDHAIKRLNPRVMNSSNLAIELQYLEIVHPETLQSLDTVVPTDRAVACFAGFLGQTRLIDNLELQAL